jgi:hypothetical protein
MELGRERNAGILPLSKLRVRMTSGKANGNWEEKMTEEGRMWAKQKESLEMTSGKKMTSREKMTGR